MNWCKYGLPLLLAFVALGSSPRPARAQPGPSAPCGSGQTPMTVDLDKAFSGHDPQVRNVWGKANVATVPASGGSEDDAIRVVYPEGSIDPGNPEAPQGGAGFELHHVPDADRRCLTYRVFFPADFRFAKGGKLPGLFGGDAPRGCAPKELQSGFSARLMWRKNGEGELYLYAPGRSTKCGESIGRGAWTFRTGAWTTISEEVVMNTPGASDGEIRIWVDGREVIDQRGVALRERPDIHVDGLLFSTFFGGHDPGWSSPVTQYAEFANFRLF
jgi:hypothetical protein